MLYGELIPAGLAVLLPALVAMATRGFTRAALGGVSFGCLAAEALYVLLF